MSLRKSGADCPYDAGELMRRGVLALVVLLLACVLMAGAVSGEKIPVKNWDELSDNITKGNSVILTESIDNFGQFSIDSGKTITLDLNSLTMSNSSATVVDWPIQINGGNLTITGGGQIICSPKMDIMLLSKGNLTFESGIFTANGDCAVVKVRGSTDLADKRYSNLKIGEMAVLKGGFYAAYISNTNPTTDSFYGITVDIAGNLSSTSDPIHGGALYINGNLQGDTVKANPSEIIIRSTAKITPSKGNAIYGAGYANWTIEDGATISGTEAIVTKAGMWLIKGGTFTSTATAPASLPPAANGNGAEITNATISLIGNGAYADNLEVTILGGTFTGAYGPALYAANAIEQTQKLASLTINGGTFTRTSNGEVINISSEFANGKASITGGTFTVQTISRISSICWRTHRQR